MARLLIAARPSFLLALNAVGVTFFSWETTQLRLSISLRLFLTVHLVTPEANAIPARLRKRRFFFHGGGVAMQSNLAGKLEVGVVRFMLAAPTSASTIGLGHVATVALMRMA